MAFRRLDPRVRRYAARQLGKETAAAVMSEVDISERSVYRIWAQRRRIGAVPEPRAPGRPPAAPARADVQAVLDEHAAGPDGVVQIAKRMRLKGSKVSYYRVYGIMKSEGLVGGTGGRSLRTSG